MTPWPDIHAEKADLDRLLARHPHACDPLGPWYDVEITYVSNAIEGSTLTRQEMAPVVTEGLTPKSQGVVRTARSHFAFGVRRRADDLAPPSPAGGRGAGGEGGRCGPAHGLERSAEQNPRATLTRNRRFRPLPPAGEVGAALAFLLLAACSNPQPDPIDGPDVITEEAIDPLPEGPLDPLAVGQRYDDVDDLVLAAVPMAPDVRVETDDLEDGQMLIKIEASGYEDDAVEGERFDVTAERGADGLTVRKIDKYIKCYRDGSDDWTTGLCP